MKMVKKVVILATVLALVLAFAQLATAQQTPDQTQPVNSTFNATFNSSFQSPDESQTPGGGQSSESQSPSPDQAQQNASQPPPSGAVPQAIKVNLDGLRHLNKKNNLVVDCAAVADKLTQLKGTPVSSPTDEKMLKQVEDLLHLCTTSGYTPASISGAPTAPNPNPNGATSPQPQQTQDPQTGG
jgi:hypothetical protein